MNLIFSKNTLLVGLCTVVLSGYSSSLYAGNSNSPEPTAVQQTKRLLVPYRTPWVPLSVPV